MLSVGVIVLYHAVLATSWNVMGGFTGYISIGHAAFFGVGAYGTGLLVIHTGMNFLLATLIAAIGTAILTIPVGMAALRVRGASFVIVTIALVLVLLLVFQSMGSVTGGSDGLVVPRPFPDLLRPQHHQVFFFLFLGLLTLCLLVWTFIDRSRFGAALKSVREDEDKAESLGSPTAALKLTAFVISATLTAICGGFYAVWFGDLDPVFQFDIVLCSTIVLMALFGGNRYLFGPLLGAIVVSGAEEYFVLNFGDTQFHLIALGLLLAIVVLFLPDGVLTGIAQLIARLRPQAASISELSAGELADQRAGRDPDAPEDGSDATDARDATKGTPRE
ncbi:branched-chain amino acid ABC transporter permease [Microbacterium sp. JB110]|nr:branched-chain amino acid ABC transporter permease [Microbacterium sp. JB110]